MPTLFYILILLSFSHSITTSQSLCLEALTPCVLTASDGGIVQAYCEETITPCVLTASNGAIIQAYCEPSWISQPFASITGIPALQNTTHTTALFQILGTNSHTISYNGRTKTATSLSAASTESPPLPSPNPSTSSSTSFSSTKITISPLASPPPTAARTSSQPGAQASPTAAFLASTALAAGPYCLAK
ncbi:hypothetical protein HO173_007084 [Letharia columbiana]|uniref:Uncharacterized protein n=1 Tax=Letharia columbiana TaxID=112416 RepID=A0A8H6FU89_9LECA|nr:uncharacterized protein HO173_007084 [Letharia columbiana]KAF6234864.1 hypothetical protein HO173_007084 [Letharia columbiana]